MIGTFSGVAFEPGCEPTRVQIKRTDFLDSICEAVGGHSLSMFKSTDNKMGIFLDQFAYEDGLFNCLIDKKYLVDNNDILSDSSVGLRIFKELDSFPIWGSFIALGVNERNEICDLSDNEWTKLESAITDPLEGQKEPFRYAFSRYVTWDINQEEAAEIAQISQSLFSSHVNQIAASITPSVDKAEVSMRELKPLPKGFDRLYKQYIRGNISARNAAQELGVSHPTFLKYVAEADRRPHLDTIALRNRSMAFNTPDINHVQNQNSVYMADR